MTMFKDYLLSSGRNGFVLSISGGQDSALAGRFCQLAVEELRSQTGQITCLLRFVSPMGSNGTKKMCSTLCTLLLPTEPTPSLFSLPSIVGKDVPEEVAQWIEQRYSATEHKRHGPVNPFDTWCETEAGDSTPR